jgi:flavin reductase (DIM6/NTAB) family NADH-FMN oxidoreductase RutF
MSEFTYMDVNRFKENIIPLFSKEWFLLTAGVKNNFNTMTCAWGGIGYLWNQPVTFVFVRPQRFTYEFVENNELFTMSFFGDTNRENLNFCGTNSGRDVDKIAETGLTPLFDIENAVYFKEARMAAICRKLSYQDIDEKGFADKPLMSAVYPEKDFHRMYVGRIEQLLVK